MSTATTQVIKDKKRGTDGRNHKKRGDAHQRLRRALLLIIIKKRVNRFFSKHMLTKRILIHLMSAYALL